MPCDAPGAGRLPGTPRAFASLRGYRSAAKRGISRCSVARLIARRILLSLLTLLLVSFIIFAVLEILPGDVATRILGRDATPESLAVLRGAHASRRSGACCATSAGSAALLHGDFGQSLVSRPVVARSWRPRIFNTVLLSLYAFLLYLPLAVIPGPGPGGASRPARSTTPSRS